MPGPIGEVGGRRSIAEFPFHDAEATGVGKHGEERVWKNNRLFHGAQEFGGTQPAVEADDVGPGIGQETERLRDGMAVPGLSHLHAGQLGDDR